MTCLKALENEAGVSYPESKAIPVTGSSEYLSFPAAFSIRRRRI